MPHELQIPAMGMSKRDWFKLPFSERALLVAVQEMRLYKTSSESNTKWGRVEEMLWRASEAPRRPWSAAFVAWCLEAALFKPSGLQYLGSPLAWITWARANSKAKTSDPARGDLLYFDKPGRRHLGFVLGRHGDRLATLEANVFKDTGRLDGPDVALLVRNVHDPDGFIALGPANAPTKRRTIKAA